MYRNPLPSVPESGTYSRVSGCTYSASVGMLFAARTSSAQSIHCRSLMLTKMSKGGTNYSNYDDHSYRYSSTSLKDNESRYLCNNFKIAGAAGETTRWGTRCQSLSPGGKTPGERCPGMLIVDMGWVLQNVTTIPT